MDFTDNFTNFNDTESEILHYDMFQSTDSENILSSNKLSKPAGTSQKRKYDSIEENIPGIKLFKTDTEISTNPNSTGNDQNVSNYFSENTEDVIFTEQSYESEDKTMFNLTPFPRKNIKAFNYGNISDKKFTASHSEDEYGTPILKFPKRMKQLKGIKKIDLTLLDDIELKTNFHAFFENMKNQNISETSDISKMTVADAKSSTPSFTVSKRNSVTGTNGAMAANEMEISQNLLSNQSLLSPKKSGVNKLSTVSATLFRSQNHSLNKSGQIENHDTSLGLQPITISTNDENIDINTEEIDQKFLSYFDINESFDEESNIIDGSIILNKEEKISNISKCDKTFLVTEYYPFSKTTTNSFTDTLVTQNSQNSELDIGKLSVGNCDLLLNEPKATETIHLQNARDKIGAIYEEQSKSNDSSEIHYMDVNVEPAENETTNNNILLKTEDKISNQSKCDEMHMLSGGYLCIDTTYILNTDAPTQEKTTNDDKSDFQKFSDRVYIPGQSYSNYSSGVYHTTANAENLSNENEISNSSTEIKNQEPFSSKSTRDIMQISFSDYSPTISIAQKLSQNESLTNFMREEKAVKTIKPENMPKQIVGTNDEVSNQSENKEPPSLKMIALQNFPNQKLAENRKQLKDNCSSEIYCIDANVERLSGENKIVNSIMETQIEGLFSNPLTCNIMQPSTKDSSSFKTSLIPNTAMDKQNELMSDFIFAKQSKANVEQKNVSNHAVKTTEEISTVVTGEVSNNVNEEVSTVVTEEVSTTVTEEVSTTVNEEVLPIVKTEEKLDNKRIRNRKKTVKREDRQKETASDDIRTMILDLVEEYIKNTNLDEFTLHDVTDFITERLPNVTHFKVIHAVRIYFVNSLKFGVLKQVGQKYALIRGNLLDV